MLKTFSKGCTVWTILSWSNEECHILWKGGYDPLIWCCWFVWKRSSKNVCQEISWNTYHTTQPSCALSSDCRELWPWMQWGLHATWSMRGKFFTLSTMILLLVHDRLPVTCEWITGLFGTCYMKRYSISSTENMWWGKQIFLPKCSFLSGTYISIIHNPRHILFCSHDVCFMHEAIFNRWNNHICDEDNPHATLLKWYQQQFAVSVWAGTVSDHFTGPYLL